MIPLPDPPLRHPNDVEPEGEVQQKRRVSPAGSKQLGLLLRPWCPDDAPALVAAWADPEIQRWTRVPAVRDRAAAERWIADDGGRRQRGFSLDLVVECGGVVAGEVGLSSFDRAAGTAEIGWWTAAEHRGQGVASTAGALVVGWALEALHLVSLIARCDVANPASVAVARRSGAMVHL